MTDDRSAVPAEPGEADIAATGIDITVPHSARIWNYWLGGKDNFAVDRAAGDAWTATFPAQIAIARASRDFLTRSIRYLAQDAGIRQFLDVGTGLPTADNTHQVAQRIAPEARIVYVDNDPLVLAHARALLTSTPEGATAYIHADLRDADQIMAQAAETLDFDKPIALILSGILGHVTDTAEARSIVANLMDALPSGSYLSLNDGTSHIGGRQQEEATRDYNDSGAVPYVQRTPEEIASFFDGLELVPPGVVSNPRWRPENPGDELPDEIDAFCGVGRKP
ncbi:MAG TPA: SAM-dependent methyltransferase [Trebonia sp.]|jgi:O-methyltransferase involved in polyketide biosynthesis|nr:SAM-dependent methyltransferase [Trebonia sp.]